MNEIEEKSLKERFDDAFNGLLNAGDKLYALSHKVEYAGKLIALNKLKQRQVQSLFTEGEE